MKGLVGKVVASLVHLLLASVAASKSARVFNHCSRELTQVMVLPCSCMNCSCRPAGESNTLMALNTFGNDKVLRTAECSMDNRDRSAMSVLRSV